MRDWQIELEKMVRFSGRLPELIREGFEANPPSGGSWPDGLPTCPALRDFYRLCDGGNIGGYFPVPLAEIADETERLNEWIEDRGGEDELTPGGWVIIGRNEADLCILWDAAKDRLFLYDSDGGGTEPAGGPVEKFLERLFNPPAPKTELPADETIEFGEGQDLWFVTLRELDRTAGPE